MIEIFRTFYTAQEARDYRNNHGTGGWIFAPEQGKAVLFPPHMMPSEIIKHPMTAGQSGRLLSN